MDVCAPETRITRSLLGYGIIAGPIYIVVSLAQALTRDGFDLGRHAWSLLANGDLGWIQIANLILTGMMTGAAALGVRRALRPGTTRTWAPPLIAGYGISMVGAGVFRADAAQGFPVGAPDTAPDTAPETVAVSWPGMLHFLLGGIGFLCLIAACFVLAAYFSSPGLVWFSRLTGVAFLAAFAGIATGSQGPATLAFVAAIVIVCAWLTTVSVHFYRAA
jgi:hypothetical protein